MAAKNNNKMNISYTIRAVDRFTDVHERLERQFNQLEAAARQLETIDPTINVDADTATAQAQVQALDNAIDRLPWYRRIWIHIEGIGNDHMKRMTRMANAIQNFNEIAMSVGQGGLFMVLPLLGPLLGSAAGGAGALASQLVGAAAGLGAFAMVAVPTIGYLREIDGEVKRGSSKWKKLSDGTRAALTALDSLRASWSKLQDKFREPTLKIFATNLETAKQALKLFEPTIEGSVKAVENLSKSLKNSLGSSDVKGIFEWFGKTGGGYLEDLMKTLGNFTVGLLNMFVAFDPLTQKFSDGFLEMSERFREWSSTLENNQAFQDFMNYVATVGPQVLSLFGNLITFLVNFGIAIEPISTKVLELTNAFFAWASEGLKTNKWVAQLITGAFMLFGAFKVLWPLINVGITAFKFLAPVITKVWSWFGKLQGAFIRIIPWIQSVATFIMGLHPVIRIIMVVVALLSAVIVRHWDEIKAWTIKTFAKVKSYIQEKWDQIGDKIDEVKEWADNVADSAADMYDSVVEWFGNIWDEVTGTWDDITAYFAEIDLYETGKDIIQGLLDGINVVDVWKSVTNVASDIKNAFLNFFDVNSPSRVMNKDVGRWITLGVLDGMVAMAGKAEREAAIVANAIKRPFDSLSTDYSFSAGVSAARGAYTAATRSSGNTVEPATAAIGGDIVIETPLYLDGREVARRTARYTRQEIRRMDHLERRFKG